MTPKHRTGPSREREAALARRHLPARLATPPFRAVRLHGIVLRAAAGAAVAGNPRVRGPGGAPIADLFAAGEPLGGGALSGDAFVGGMSVTPALSFGRWLGRTFEPRGEP
jgi:fumarate reductase flavoprotein subunit